MQVFSCEYSQSDPIEPVPTPTETLLAINNTVHDLLGAADDLDTTPTISERRLARLLAALAKGPSSARDEAEHVLVAPLMTTLRQVRDLLGAEHVSIEALPLSLTRRWISADGLSRIEVVPAGDGNDNETLRRFVTAVRGVAPEAAGKPIFVIEAAATIVKAFLQAGIWSVASITLVSVRRATTLDDVALTLVPLLVAIVVTLETCVVIGLQLKFQT